jgi:hypothetical protein
LRHRSKSSLPWRPEGAASRWRQPSASSRWRPEDSSGRKAALAVALNVVPGLVGLIGLIFLAPSSPDFDPFIAGALVVISGLAYLTEIHLKPGIVAFFGAGLAIVLVALATQGVYVALAVWLVPDVLGRYVLRIEPKFSPGLVATVGSYLLAVLAGGWILELAGETSGGAMAPALYSAGLAMALLNFTFARLTFAPFYWGDPPMALIRGEFFALLPVVMGMLLIGVMTAVLVDLVGVFALAPLAFVIVLPRIAVERISRTQSVARLERAEAMQVYVAAIADVLGLSREEREELACAADLIEPVRGNSSGINGFEWGRAHVPGAAMLALHAGERWAGTGWPAGLPADAIPYGSRILAVAQAWTDLTAKGTLELSQAEAMLALSAQTDTDFDPAIVDAALKVVADEAGFAQVPNFQPKLHEMPLPRTVRRGALPSMMPRLVDPSVN